MPAAKELSLKEAVFNVQANVTKVGKDGYNPHTKKNYATLEGVLEVLEEPLRENRIIVTQNPRFIDGQWVLSTTVCLAAGDTCESFDTPLLGLGNGNNAMQALGSAITYARRYALVTYFKIATTDDDGEDLRAPSMNFTSKKSKPFIISDGSLKDKDASKMKPEELNSYLKNINDALEQTGGKKPKWFSDLEAYVAEREKA